MPALESKNIQVNYNNGTYQKEKRCVTTFAMVYIICKNKIKLILLIIVFHLSRNFPTKFLKAKARWTAITLNNRIPEN